MHSTRFRSNHAEFTREDDRNCRGRWTDHPHAENYVVIETTLHYDHGMFQQSRQFARLTFRKDVHSRYRSSSGSSVVARFNERFILSLGSCDDCLVLDDELNVLPISRGKDIRPLDGDALEKGKGKALNQKLASLRESFDEDKLQGPLVKLAKTIDQVCGLLEPC